MFRDQSIDIIPQSYLKNWRNQAMHPSRRSAANLNHSFLAATWVIAAVISSIRSTFNLHMGLKMAIPYPENADGDFYVERDCCTLCDVPMVEAPGLFTYALGDDGKPDHCYVSKQPSNGSETESMISAIQCAELRCIRYRGRDQTILTRLIKIGESEICDNLE